MSTNVVSSDFSALLEMNPCDKGVNGFNGTLKFALFIIGCVAAAGHMTGVVAGGCVVGLSIPIILAAIGQLIGGEQKVDAVGSIILSIFLSVMGSLAIPGIVTPVVTGWCVIVPTLISLSLVCCICCCVGCVFGVMTVTNR